MIFFGNKLLRGNRSVKNNTSGMVAFESPNVDVLGEIGVNFHINWHLVLRHNFDGQLEIFTKMSEDISIVNITPCINLNVFKSIF